MSIYTARGQVLRLGEQAGTGGEATVYRVQGQPDRLAKLYDHPTRPGYAEKLAWMLENPPENPTHELQHASLAWPAELLYDTPKGESARLVGYLMPFVRGSTPILNIFNPRQRRRTLPDFNTRYLHRAARNLAAALGAVHRRGYVVGDLNESNILVTPQALITIIDTDSFQVRAERNGNSQTYYCPVGKAEYTAPELQGKPLARMLRNPEQDAFALGVLIFQLLMDGNHPFRAKWLGKGEPPALEARIAQGYFPYIYSPGMPVSPPARAPGLNRLHPLLAELARRCFADGHRHPELRPTPVDWELAVAEAERCLIECQHRHIYSSHLASCPICAQGGETAGRAETSRGVRRSQPFIPRPAGQTAAKPGPASTRGSARPAAPGPGAASGAKPAAPATPPPTSTAKAKPGATRPWQRTAQANPSPPASPHGRTPAPGSPSPSPMTRLQRVAIDYAKQQARAYIRRQLGMPPASPAPTGSTPAGSASTTNQQATAPTPGAGSSTSGTAGGSVSGKPGGVPAAGFSSARQTPSYPTPSQAASVHSGSVSGSWRGIPRPAWSYWRSARVTSWKRTLAQGSGYGALTGLAIGLSLALLSFWLEFDLAFAVLVPLSAAAAGGLRGWKPGQNLDELVTHTIGWRTMLQWLGISFGALGGLLLALPFFLIIFPLFLGLIGGGMLGHIAGRKAWEKGLKVGWDRISPVLSTGGAAASMGLLLRWAALTPAGAQTAEWVATLSTWITAQSGSLVLGQAGLGVAAGALAGAIAGVLVDASARLVRLSG